MNLEIPDISSSWAGAHVLRTHGDWGEIDLMGGASFRSLYDWGKALPLGVVIPASFVCPPSQTNELLVVSAR